ncbi:MAG: RnfABCDGE type electron transport complex subunit B [Cetobacterium sp.]
METIFLPVLILGGTGLFMGLFLAYASKKFEVEVDPKVEAVVGVLPGINCGACGYPGCSGYAEAIALNGAEITSCSPGGAAVASQRSEIMGMTVDLSGPKMVAKILCQGDNTRTSKTYEFEGELKTCAALMNYAGGDKSCKYGCLGYGDCVKVCPADAIVINDKGIASIDENKCISCKKCVSACPKYIIEMLPQNKKVTVVCSSRDKGAVARKVCTVPCIGCGICVKACPVDAIIVENNLARINPDKCIECGLCAVKCPTKAINSDVKEIKKAEIIEEKCIGCSACARVCPVKCISGEIKQKYKVDESKCIGCQLCYDKCKFSAIKINVQEIK